MSGVVAWTGQTVRVSSEQLADHSPVDPWRSPLFLPPPLPPADDTEETDDQ